MATGLILPESYRRTQPYKRVAVNWRNPLTRGLVFALDPLNAPNVDLVSGAVARPVLGIPAYTTNYVIGAKGTAARLRYATASAGGYLAFANRIPLDRVTGPCSVFLEGAQTDESQSLLFSSGENPTTNAGFALRLDDITTTSDSATMYVNNSDRTRPLGGFSNPFPPNKLHRVAVGLTGAQHLWFGNGAFMSAETSTSTPNLHNNRRTRIGSQFWGGSSNVCASWASFGLAWNRVLSDAEFLSLLENPWQVLEDEDEITFFVSGASSPPTAPTIGATTSITQTGATVNWTDNSADETGFKVEYAASPYSAWTAAATTAADATSYALTGLIEKTTYKARVASTNANGDSAWVESAEFTTLAVPRGSLLGVG